MIEQTNTRQKRNLIFFSLFFLLCFQNIHSYVVYHKICYIFVWHKYLCHKLNLWWDGSNQIAIEIWYDVQFILCCSEINHLFIPDIHFFVISLNIEYFKLYYIFFLKIRRDFIVCFKHNLSCSSFSSFFIVDTYI